jgi:hypothetical protein
MNNWATETCKEERRLKKGKEETHKETGGGKKVDWICDKIKQQGKAVTFSEQVSENQKK